MSVIALDHLVLTVEDIDRTVDFYRDVLGMMPAPFNDAEGGERMALTFGEQKINLHQAGAEYEPRAIKAAPGTADLCFLTEVPLETWVEHFDRHGLSLVDGPAARSGATGPLTSVYIRDPDGNLIEVSVRS